MKSVGKVQATRWICKHQKISLSSLTINNKKINGKTKFNSTDLISYHIEHSVASSTEISQLTTLEIIKNRVATDNTTSILKICEDQSIQFSKDENSVDEIATCRV